MPRPSLPARAGARLGAGVFASAVLAAGAGFATPSAVSSTGPAEGVTHESAATAGVSASPNDEEDEAPLALTIDAMTPGTLPEKGPIRIRGTVTNRDDETWSEVQLFPFAGTQAPMTTAAELEVAAETSPTAVVGPRMTEVMDVVEELAPGETASYRLRVPRRLIDIEAPGIYWFGVHALGQSDSDARDAFADGRARTFLPHLPDPEGVVPTSIVVPLRAEIDHTNQGAVARPDRWRRSLDSGSMGRLLDFGDAADGRPVSWLLDPAVLDTVDQLRVGNPPRSIAPTTSQQEGATETAEPEPGPSAAPTADTALARTAEAWLGEARSAMSGATVLTLPYGDLDVSAAAEHDPALYDTAREQESDVLAEWQLSTTPAVTSPSGFLDPAGLSVVDDNPVMLLTERMFPAEEFPDGAPPVVSVDGHRAAVTSYAAQSGGPGPDDPTSAVALRQRVLSEAAARIFESGSIAPRPLVVELPRDVSGEPTQFWSGLEQPWLTLRTAERATSGTATALDAEELDYPEQASDLELPREAFVAAAELSSRGPVLADLLALNDTIDDRLQREMLTGLGHGQRDAPEDAVARLRATGAWTRERISGVDIVAPPGVTLASGTGDFAVTLRNTLQEPVEVGIVGRSEGAAIDPVEPLVVAPGSRSTVFLNARASGTRVHNLSLELVSASGADLGVSATVPVRSGQASVVIWWIIGTGAGILVLAVAIRVLRRLRGASTGSSTGEDPEGSTGGDDSTPANEAT